MPIHIGPSAAPQRNFVVNRIQTNARFSIPITVPGSALSFIDYDLYLGLLTAVFKDNTLRIFLVPLQQEAINFAQSTTPDTLFATAIVPRYPECLLHEDYMPRLTEDGNFIVKSPGPVTP